jgi:D-serine deaminase-like pyridoxal phosphate-dependent protein
MSLLTPTDQNPELYRPVDEIETPAVVADLDVMEENVRRYVEFADEQDVRLRSHVKTHKTPALAHYQNEVTGGGGIVCQTLSEAEVMAQNGIDDIYLSYMVVSEPKLQRLVWLSETVDRFATTVDCPGNITPVQEVAAQHGTTIDVILELDVGLERVGVPPGQKALDRAQLIADQPNLDLQGIMAFEGNVRYDPDEDTVEGFESRCLETVDEVADTVGFLSRNGIDVKEVKVGSTPTSLYSGKHPIVTEINPGMYPFNDVHTFRQAPHLQKADCSLTVLTTVISKPDDERVVVDAGSKSISLELDDPPLEKRHENVRYYNASEEHGWVDTSDYPGSLEVGDRLRFIPPHVCPTINLHDTLVGIHDGRVENVWSVQARGKVK